MSSIDIKTARHATIALALVLLTVTTTRILPPVCCMFSDDSFRQPAAASCCAPEQRCATKQETLADHSGSDFGMKECCFIRTMNVLAVAPPPRHSTSDSSSEALDWRSFKTDAHRAEAPLESLTWDRRGAGRSLSNHLAHTIILC